MSPLYGTSREKKPSLGSFDASNKSSSGLLVVAWRINYYAEQACSPSISLPISLPIRFIPRRYNGTRYIRVPFEGREYNGIVPCS